VFFSFKTNKFQFFKIFDLKKVTLQARNDGAWMSSLRGMDIVIASLRSNPETVRCFWIASQARNDGLAMTSKKNIIQDEKLWDYTYFIYY